MSNKARKQNSNNSRTSVCLRVKYANTFPFMLYLFTQGFLAIKSTATVRASCLLVHKCRYIQLVHTQPSHLMRAKQQLSRRTCTVSDWVMKGNSWSLPLFLCFKALNGRFLQPLSLSCGSLRFVSSSFKVLKQTCCARFMHPFFPCHHRSAWAFRSCNYVCLFQLAQSLWLNFWGNAGLPDP